VNVVQCNPETPSRQGVAVISCDITCHRPKLLGSAMILRARVSFSNTVCICQRGYLEERTFLFDHNTVSQPLRAHTHPPLG